MKKSEHELSDNQIILNHRIKKAYFQAVETITLMAKDFPDEELKNCIQVHHPENQSEGLLHELVTPVVHLQLKVGEHGAFAMRYAVNEEATSKIGIFHALLINHSILEPFDDGINPIPENVPQAFIYSYENCSCF